jgi:molybdenum cofactor cytidylyltransferase
VLIAQADMPGVDGPLIGQLMHRFVTTGAMRVTVPWITGEGAERHGNPVIWPRRLFAELAALTGDQGGRALIKSAGDALERVPVHGPAAAIDIDTPGQLAAYVRQRDAG